METESKVSNGEVTTGTTVRYMRTIVKRMYDTDVLNKLLSNLEDLNFEEIYCSSEEEKENIKKLKLCMETTKDWEEKRDIRKELQKYEPREDVKYIIIAEEILRIADELKLGVCIDENGGFPYYYNGCYWEIMSRSMAKEFIAEVATRSGFNYYDTRIKRFMEAIYNQFIALQTLSFQRENNDEVRINLRNGTFVVNKDSQELRDFEKDDFFKYQLPFEYDKNATAPMFENFLDEVLPDKLSQMLLLEFLGYIFIRGLKLEKCLVLLGEGSNGKSVVFDIVSALLGVGNVCSYTLSNLCNDTGYYRAQLSNYLLNYSSEIGGKNCNADVVKKLISNEPVDARSPYGEPFILRDYGKFIFNANRLPSDMENTHAYFRRFIFLPFNVEITEEKADKYLSRKIIDKELSGIFNLVLDGMKRLLGQKKFTESKEVNELIGRIKTDNDSVALFMEDLGLIPSPKGYGKEFHRTLKVLRAEYDDFCKENSYHPCGTKEFSKRLRRLGYEVLLKCSNNETWVLCMQSSYNNESIKETQDLVAKFAESSIRKQSE